MLERLVSTIRSIGSELAWTRPLQSSPRGQATGPNANDRGNLGCKRHVAADGRGVPLALLASGANKHNSVMLEPLLQTPAAVAGLLGRPRM